MSATRRSLLGAAGAAALASLPVVADAGAHDPVLPLYRRWRVLEDASDIAEAKHTAWCNAHPAADPCHPEGVRLVKECDRLNGESTDILEEIMRTPAATRAGALAKLRISAVVRPKTKPAEEFEFHEDMARNAVLDAVRLFGEGRL